jgi:hypothetical protein
MKKKENEKKRKSRCITGHNLKTNRIRQKEKVHELDA